MPIPATSIAAGSAVAASRFLRGHSLLP